MRRGGEREGKMGGRRRTVIGIWSRRVGKELGGDNGVGDDRNLKGI